MLYHSFLKISVLVSTFYLSALIVSSSWDCIGGYTPHIGQQAFCQLSLTDKTTQILCTGSSCWNRALNTAWIPMHRCLWVDRRRVHGLSQQQCAGYEWEKDRGPYHSGAYACTNPGGHHYICDVPPQKTGHMTCDDCDF
ncbi:uncharacterized protein MELLADRAFT_124161 [Melampsora larici-populina 98AG31]|uniref:Secreted protein n=1 Tax=Melampsora larici-populina (strain 98AG31 / pathotype 3-4-7) TaxID=747676 RepID=F4RND5_MELLP|nr:uncharacterized protein MELLADRAFT_124161 [Melampsora larici-populina 98AG31]EGG06116.1 secreted protein [Melampsora larici-populina 98AG31]